MAHSTYSKKKSVHLLEGTMNLFEELKGSLTRDFRLQVFFMNQCPPGPQVFHWSQLDTGNKLFSGVNDTGEKFIAGVIDTGD
jgi:hypothetical protein